ncbi:MAG: hypothetical protein VW405_01280 [Rhodospirillaceae bacterium]
MAHPVADRAELDPAFAGIDRYPQVVLHSTGKVVDAGQMKIALTTGLSDGAETIWRFRMTAEEAERMARIILENIALYRAVSGSQSERSSGRPSVEGSPSEGQAV